MTRHRLTDDVHTQTHPRGRGIYALIALVGAFCATVGSFAFGVDHHALDPFSAIPRPAYTSSPDPITAALSGRHPTDIAQGGVPLSTIRAIVVSPRGVALRAGGKQTRFLRGSVTSLEKLADKVADPEWIRRDSSGVQVLAGIVLDHTPLFEVTGPVQLVDRPGVFIAAKSSNLAVRDATIAGVDESSAPAPADSTTRPFLLADQGTMMTLERATLQDLGYDWNASYGVSWLDGSRGGSTSSTFLRNFVGVYTDHVTDLQFRGDRYLQSVLYGFDPHSSTRRLSVADCLARDNGAHGIIFSEDVTNSTVSGCTSIGNGENGIMMDAASSHNTLTGNRVESNRGDGIVLADSPMNAIRGNTVAGNRVGIQVSGTSQVGTQVWDNEMTHNRRSAQGVEELTTANRSHLNGGEWQSPRVRLVGLVVTGIVLSWTAVTLLLRRRRRGSAQLSHS